MLYLPWVDTHPAKGLYSLEERVENGVRTGIQGAVFLDTLARQRMTMEDRILSFILWRQSFRMTPCWVRTKDIEYACDTLFTMPSMVSWRTGLQRLIKSGKLERQLITRGWDRYYCYRVIL